MKKLILVRHGQSVYNLEHKFTGWEDAPLTETGVLQAQTAGNLLANAGLKPGIAFTSLLRRARQTLAEIRRTIRSDTPVTADWRLNERHYGALQGLTREEAFRLYRKENVLSWRRTYTAAPPPAEDNSSSLRLVPPGVTPPNGESLQACIARLSPFWRHTVLPAFQTQDAVLVVAHEDLLRGLIKQLKNQTDAQLEAQVIPPAGPWVFELDGRLRPANDFLLGNPDELRRFLSARPQ